MRYYISSTLAVETSEPFIGSDVTVTLLDRVTRVSDGMTIRYCAPSVSWVVPSYKEGVLHSMLGGMECRFVSGASTPERAVEDLMSSMRATPSFLVK